MRTAVNVTLGLLVLAFLADGIAAAPKYLVGIAAVLALVALRNVWAVRHPDPPALRDRGGHVSRIEPVGHERERW
jgi:hypothetical protein